MSKNDFPESEFRARRERLRRAMEAAALDWLVVIHPASLHWLTGSETKGYTSFQCLLFPQRPAPLTMFARELDRSELEEDSWVDEVRGWNGREPEDPMEAFAKLALDLKLTGSRVGMEVPAWYLHPNHHRSIKAMLGPSLAAEGTSLVQDLKLVKSPREIAYIRASARIADDALAALLARVAEGRSELELAAAAYGTLLAAGSSQPASTMNLVTGERCHFVLAAPTPRQIRRGDPGHVEIGAAYHRYTATLGRVWNLGEPTARLRELHAVIRAASDACIGAIRAGVPATVPHEAAKRMTTEAGLDQFRQHTSGYGIGPGFPPSWGEPVNLFGGNRYVLEAGMVVSVEPHLFIREERLGVRLIDNVLVTETGAELLSRHPRELVPLP
ncbi:MAG TPA: Xaa-Pro peptidase family protein [Acetobacteraceae bacterium]|nr:Xaa-Pro peptidase family protein [Acetobacteraceae bacterium]